MNSNLLDTLRTELHDLSHSVLQGIDDEDEDGDDENDEEEEEEDEDEVHEDQGDIKIEDVEDSCESPQVPLHPRSHG